MQTKKVFSIIGIIIGCIMLFMGVFHQTPSFDGGTMSTYTSFGADFYTEEYQATAQAATNVYNLGQFEEEIFDMALIFAGLIVICYFGCKLGEASHSPVSVPVAPVKQDALPKL